MPTIQSASDPFGGVVGPLPVARLPMNTVTVLEPESPVPVASLVLRLDHIDPGTTKAHFKTENAVAPVTYDFGDGTTHTPVDVDTAHTYAAAGHYAVRVVDGTGDSAGVEIDVPAATADAPAPPAEPAVEAPPDPAAPAVEPEPAPFDPGGHTVAEVIAYAEGKEEEEIVRLIELEETDRNRSTLLAQLEQMLS